MDDPIQNPAIKGCKVLAEYAAVFYNSLLDKDILPHEAESMTNAYIAAMVSTLSNKPKQGELNEK